MSRLDEIPPDQRAALSLLLRQRKSYAEVASLLGIQERAVHDRAHGALAMLAPQRARDVVPEQRLEIGDYLLSQQPGVAERLRTRTLMSTSEPARAWAADVAAQLAPLAGAELPEVPAAAAAPGPQRVGDLASSAPAASAVAATAGGNAMAGGGAGAAGAPGAPASRPSSSRLGGALVLAAIAAAIVVVIVLVTGGGSGKSSTAANAKTSAATTTAASKTGKGPTVTARLTLRPPSAKSKSIGAVDILQEGGKRAFFIEAQHLPASRGFFYAIWLYNSHTSSLPLSKSPAVGASHRLAGGALLPGNAGSFREMLLTRETASHPKHPGHVVLRGPFTLSQ
jgi:hypothetical protein